MRRRRFVRFQNDTEGDFTLQNDRRKRFFCGFRTELMVILPYKKCAAGSRNMGGGSKRGVRLEIALIVSTDFHELFPPLVTLAESPRTRGDNSPRTVSPIFNISDRPVTDFFHENQLILYGWCRCVRTWGIRISRKRCCCSGGSSDGNKSDDGGNAI